MRLSLIIFVLSLNQYAIGQKNYVCFTFDDLPVVSYSITDTVYKKDLNNKLVKTLEAYKIPAIGFVNERKLYTNGTLNTFQVSLLNTWVDNDLELGNHTYSHIDYNSTTLEKYAQDILKGEKITRDVVARKQRTLKYFRHPFLHTGNSKAKSDSLNAFLTGNGYTVAPVTIDNADYLFALAYHRAYVKNDLKLMSQIGQDYIAYMEKMLKYYEKQSHLLYGRNISHILLLHENALNSDYVDELATMFQKNNYTFISLSEALKDPVYQSEITSFGNWGISWLDRWALSAGKKDEFFKEEPTTPEYIIKLNETR